MSAIVKELTIAAPMESVYKTLTEQDAIANWWTDDLTVQPEMGSLAEFRFTKWGGGILQFEITELTELTELKKGATVSWLSRKGPPYWIGTNVTWRLTPSEDGTRLLFTHDGFAQTDDSYERVSENWTYFLNSLKSYLETGKGTPGHPLYIR